MMRKKTEQLWNQAEALHGRWPDSQSRAELADLLTQLRLEPKSDAETSLLLGYLAYHFPDPSTADIDVENELKDALSRDPQNITANLYLAHHYFDTEKYADALTYLERIDEASYQQIGQVWRSLKICELKLCARLNIAPSSVAPDELVSFLQKLLAEEVDHVAVPTELVDALLKNKSALAEIWTVSCRNVVASLLRTAIDRIARPDTLQEKIDMIGEA